jgi:hypothetical protein
MPDKPFDLNRIVAEAILDRTIRDEDMVIPAGSIVFICRTASVDDNESLQSPQLFLEDDVYAAVATVAVNRAGVALGWRLFVPFDAVKVKGSIKLRHVAASYGDAIAEACEDEADAG